MTVCATDSPTSLENVRDKWWPEVLLNCPDTPLILVGMKQDLRQDEATIEKLHKQNTHPVTHLGKPGIQ